MANIAESHIREFVLDWFEQLNQSILTTMFARREHWHD